jgi:NADH-quinone oxidoreductase subunit L
MFIAAGVGAYQGAMFHLFTHAFFKALLFLSAGSVIVGMHHEQDMRKMGALWNKLPITYAVMLIGTLAITGVGLPGLDLGFAGFYSKDAIINAAYAAGGHSQAAMFAFVVAVLAAGLTSFYSWRLIFMTFHGHAKWGAHDVPDPAGHEPVPDDHHGHDDHGHDGHGHEPHESPWVMLAPLVALALGAVFAGGLFVESFVGEHRAEFWKGAIFTAASNTVLDHHALPAWEVWAPLTVTAIGFVAAWYAYIAREGMGAEIAARKGPLWTLLYNKWFFDELYDFIFVRAAKGLGDLFWKGGDVRVIDGLGPNGVAAVSYVVGRRAGKMQTGYVYHYAFVMLLGVAGLLSFALYAWSR